MSRATLTIANVTHIFVLSARHTFLGEPQDLLLKERKPEDCDLWDTLERLLTGICLAYEITALRLNKTIPDLTYKDLLNHGAKIIFNGSKKQNEQLLRALLENKMPERMYNQLIHPQYIIKLYSQLSFQIKSMLYPASQFILSNLNPDAVHTKGQFEDLAQHADELGIKHAKLVIVTHDYHKERVGRLIAQHILPQTMEVIYCRFVGKRPGDYLDRAGETERVERYRKQFGLPDRSSSLIYHDRGRIRLFSKEDTKKEAPHSLYTQDDMKLNFSYPRSYRVE